MGLNTDMSGMTVLVTGGGSGIGLAAARQFFALGANVFIVGRDQTRLDQAVAEMGGGPRLKAVRGDVSREGNANKVAVEVVRAFGSLNVLANCAGVFRGGSLFDMTEEDFDYVMDVNLKGAWFMSKFCGRIMRDGGGGSIVNVSSYLGAHGYRGLATSAYSASKGGVIALTRALAVELAPHKIRVNCVVPALVETPMVAALAGADGMPKLIEQSQKLYPAGRIGQPADIASAIAFLADPGNSWITGVALDVDGGRSAV